MNPNSSLWPGMDPLLAAVLKERHADPDALMVWVVYRRPKDMPHTEFVVRGQLASRGGPSRYTEAFCFTSLDLARQPLIQAGLMRLERHPQDDVAIVETWL